MSEITIIDEHPIPLSEDRATELQELLPTFDTDNGVLHPDELHDQLGSGIEHLDEQGSFESFVGALTEAISLD